MKVLLVATNQTDRYMDRMVVRPVPIGLAYLAASVDEERHDLKVLDLMFSEDAVGDVESAVVEFQPELIGLSIRNLDNQSTLNSVWNLPPVRDIVRKIKSVSSAVTVCGGPAFSIFPSECLDIVEADLGIAGDAAEAFSTLIDRVAEGADYKDIPGIVYRDGDDIVVTEGRFSETFHKTPRLDLLDMHKYDGSGFGVGVVNKLAQAYYPTTKGGEFTGEDWRIREVEEVVGEIKQLGLDFGINKIYLIDSGFNTPISHAKKLCRTIISEGLKIRWNSGIKAGECDLELVQLMKESGCSLVLMTVGRTPRPQNSPSGSAVSITDIAALLREVELPYLVNLTFGQPGETKDSVEDKLSLLKEMKPSLAILHAGERLLPNSDLSKIALEEGLIESESELVKPVFYVASEVREWLSDRLKAEAEANPRWNLR